MNWIANLFDKRDALKADIEMFKRRDELAQIYVDTIAECHALKAELERVKSEPYLLGIERANREVREERDKLRAALEDAASGLQNAWEDLGNCEEERCVPTIGEVSSCRAYLDDARQALLAAKRDEGDV